MIDKMNNPTIHIISSIDCGVNWDLEQQERYCQEVTIVVKSSYPEYDVTCEPGHVMSDKVSVVNPEENYNALDEIEKECKNICQDVWDEGNFWD